jgi:hypothetical protein
VGNATFLRDQAAFFLRLSLACSDPAIASLLRSKAAGYHERALWAELDLGHDEVGGEENSTAREQQFARAFP